MPIRTQNGMECNTPRVVYLGSTLSIDSFLNPNQPLFPITCDLTYLLSDGCTLEKYRGKDETNKTLNMSNFPDVCFQTLETLKYSFPHHHSKPGFNSMIAACIDLGLNIIEDEFNIGQLWALKKRHVKASPLLDGDVKMLINQHLGSFKLNHIPAKKQTKYNPRMPEEFIKRLSKFSQDTGMASQQLAALCLCLVLSRQEVCNKDYQKIMLLCVNEFIKSLNIRITASKALMDAFNVHVPNSNADSNVNTNGIN